MGRRGAASGTGRRTGAGTASGIGRRTGTGTASGTGRRTATTTSRGNGGGPAPIYFVSAESNSAPARNNWDRGLDTLTGLANMGVAGTTMYSNLISAEHQSSFLNFDCYSQ